ncbi:hypothetical protein DFH08DRAFT_773532 [Mycena albidolilacea]|uniref:DUF6589 domain-containing protein n=1 Tax=Mycena albidolilacea TaxID=1033008 RepID=A0AAD7ABR0_9AGAR|nr:hypothetical protein DFH08DRAFT_773532 [Mycena albidolilacea]
MEPFKSNPEWTVPHTPQPRSPPGADSPLCLRSYNSNGSFFANTTPSTSAGSFFFENAWSTPLSFAPIDTPESGDSLSGTRKRRHSSTGNDENIPPTPAEGSTSKKARTSGASSTRRKLRSDSEKLQSILASIRDQKWTLGEFLYKVFNHQGREGSRTQTHAQMVSSFLGGQGNYTPSHILTCWMSSPDGVLPAHDSRMYSTHTPYTEIRPVRAALTSFALQIVGDFLAHGAENAVKATSGLHVSLTSKNPDKQMGWLRLGTNTIPFVGEVLDRHLKAASYFLERIATRNPRTRDGAVAPPRKHRPAKWVILHALADLLFCRTKNANLLPLARGILYFGCSVPVDIMAYNSRIGTMPSYSTIHNHLQGLSSSEALMISVHGSDPTKAGAMYFDNVQNLARVRDHRVGRENHMNAGMSGLWVETWSIINIHVFDLSDKRQRITYSERATMTVDRLLSFLDQEDANTTGYLEWLEVLTRCVQTVKYHRAEVKAQYRGTAKLLVPLEQSIVHPLAPSGKKQTIPTELKDGLLDFLQQVGQTAGSYIPRKMVIGGDGLSYAMVLQLQSYLQFHEDSFKSFEIFEPQLQVWHTKWTDIIRIFQTHWGRTSGKSTNPASLGHSAGKIGRATPSNMKKVEFYPGSQLLYLVLDARMLDCWSLVLGTDDIFAYFKSLEHQKKLPTFEELSEMAKKLHRTYSTARARDHAIHDTGANSAWAKTVPAGSLWIPRDKRSGCKSKKKNGSIAPSKGDFVLAQAIDFLRDGINSRKLATAVAEGDVGRLYECIKASFTYMLFTFSGSTHTNYMGYLLETIMNLELESSPGLRAALLMLLVINLTGLAGHFEEGDYVVEFFNRLLEDIVKHKNAQFDDKFIRDVVSRNLRQIAQLKLAWRTSTGMAQKSHVHSDPHTRPEMQILLKLYRTEELHSRRLGRQIDDRDTDDFGKGLKKLREGGLQKFIDKSLRTRRKRQQIPQPAPIPADDDSSDDGDDGDHHSENSDDDSDADVQDIYATRGSAAIVDGELVMDGRDMLEGPLDDIFPDPESEESDAEDD